MHRIRRQILDLELPREAGAVALQRRASRVFQEQVLPRLDEAFSRIAPADRIVRIERLELDLGELSEANWERDFVEKCVAQIGQQVAEAAFKVGGEFPSETLSVDENTLAIFLYFLETGILPWHAKHLTLKALEEAVLRAMASGATFQTQALHRILKENSGALQRLAWQFGIVLSEKVVESALGISEGWVQHAIQIRQSQTGQKMSAKAFQLLARHLFNAEISVLKSTPPTPALLAQLFFEKNPAASKSPTANTHSDSELQIAAPTPATHNKLDRPKTTQPKTDPIGISVDNAGLALLAVYLPPFLKKLGIELLTDNQLPESLELSGSLITNHQSTNQPITIIAPFISSITSPLGKSTPKNPCFYCPKSFAAWIWKPPYLKKWI
ncbi:MAG: hypothetical protein H7246_03385 [Phycisphaerae bacterium]|nr:hypothetical protein [Saprospiraceae bacterium]